MDKYKALKEYFGYDTFKNGQEEVIDNVLSGRDVMCIMPTGAGKSICYQIPALILSGMTVVVSPLISLMRDQVTSLQNAGIRAACINSSLSASEYNDVLQRLVMGWYKILFVAPERLLSNRFLSVIVQQNISFIAVDEAHCISQWGQDFRPSYLQINQFVQLLPVRPVVGAFTATATWKVAEDIKKHLALNDPFQLTTGFDRPNLYFSVVHPKNKDEEVINFLENHRGKSGIIYCTTRKDVESLCDTLCAHGINATRYHAGLNDIERASNQEDFIFDKKSVMVATNAFGMGIDKSNVSFVIHYQMPKDIESYYQEAGRAGRDGTKAECVLLYDPRDIKICQFLINNNVSNPQLDESEQQEFKDRELQRLRYMSSYCTTSDCLRSYILRYFGERSSGYCSNCSNCQKGSKKIDITVDAKKIISCIVRSGRRFGIKMIVDILLGKHTERIDKNGLSQISTFGLMSDVQETWIKKEIDVLIYNNILILSKDEYHILQPGKKAAAILKDEIKVEMEIPALETQTLTERESALDVDLYSELKKLRLKLSLRASIPAYSVFSDATLLDMCQKRPRTREELIDVSGVSRAKLARFGNDFLKCIAAHQGKAMYPSENKEAVRFSDKQRPWTPEEDDSLRMEAYDKIPVSFIARSHNRSSSSVIRRLQILGLSGEEG